MATITPTSTMIRKEQPSLLEQLSKAINIDADTLDVAFVSSLPIQVHDVTSNQRFVQEALEAEVNKELVAKTVKEMKGQPWEEVYAVCLARFGKNMLPHISGRLLAQTSAHHAFDEEYVYQNAKRYARAWNAEGITNDRFCVKIATTSAGVRAAKRLKAEGIATLGTALFSLPQAIAASQAGMHAISMYFNEPLAHADASIWPDVADPATEHPMAHRHYQIRKHYDALKAKGKAAPQMKTASFVSVYEVMAMPELGADNITVGLPLLTDLASYEALPAHQKGRWKQALSDVPGINDPHFVWQDWTAKRPDAEARRAAVLAKANPMDEVMTKDARFTNPDTNYLEGSVLDDVNEKDEVTRLRLKEGLRRFGLMEDASRKLIEDLQAL